MKSLSHKNKTPIAATIEASRNLNPSSIGVNLMSNNSTAHLQCLDQHLSSLRSLVAKAFVNQHKESDGRSYFRHSRTKAELSDEVITLAIANNIEGALIETYGRKKGRVNAAVMLITMLSPSVVLDKTVYKPAPGKKIDKSMLVRDLNRVDFDSIYQNEKSIQLSEVGDSIMKDLFMTMINEFESNGFKLPQSNFH